jgi:hypothetical protein
MFVVVPEVIVLNSISCVVTKICLKCYFTNRIVHAWNSLPDRCLNTNLPSDAICVKIHKDAARDAKRCVKMQLEMRKDG